MADISDYLDNEMTLNKMSEILVIESIKKKRNYLGMSEIGEDCWRMLWYRFRNVLTEHLTLKSILAIEDGYKQEDIMADRLRKVPGVVLETINPDTGDQFAFKLFGGHFRGHCDGRIKGILEAPKTPHVWENKAVKLEKFKKLKDLILTVGEKSALEKWDSTYFAQAQIYMDSEKFTRHYLTVEAPGGRDYTSCRTEYNGRVALALKAKAEAIIKADRPPQRLSENRTFYKCGWCRMKEICFDNKVPDVNCRTCAFSEPVLNDKTNEGTWHCFKKSTNFIGSGVTCDEHLFLNTLVPFKTIDADSSKPAPNWIKYGLDSGETFYNVNSKAKKIPSSTCLTSSQIFEKEYFELCFSEEKVNNENLKSAMDDKSTTKKLKGVI
jgi:hypothetical protein